MDAESEKGMREEPTTLVYLRLNNILNCRRSMARLIRLRARRQLDDKTFRSLVYGMSNLLSCFRTEKEIADFDARLQALEDAASV